MSDPWQEAIDGRWRNGSGSELSFQQTGATLAGTYRTAIGNADHGKAYPLTGRRDGRCLGFCVSWAPDSDSLTSWTGLLEKGADGEFQISAMWLLVSGTIQPSDIGLPRRDARSWEAFQVQAATFRRLFAHPVDAGPPISRPPRDPL